VCLRKEGRKEEENEGGWDIESKKVTGGEFALPKALKKHRKKKHVLYVCIYQGMTTHTSEEHKLIYSFFSSIPEKKKWRE